MKTAKPSKPTSAPTLANGNDAEVAATALRLMTRANEGFLCAVALGFLCDWIKSQLPPRGGFNEWVEAHMGVERMTVWRWRATANRIQEIAGIKRNIMLRMGADVAQLLLLPEGEVPAAQQAVIGKLREAILNTGSQRAVIPKLIDGAVTLDLLQCEDDAAGDPTVKVGRLAGQGGREPDRHALPGEALAEETATAKQYLGLLYRDLGNLGERLVLLDDVALHALDSALDRHLKAIRLWTKTPTAKRDARAVAEALKAN